MDFMIYVFVPVPTSRRLDEFFYQTNEDIELVEGRWQHLNRVAHNIDDEGSRRTPRGSATADRHEAGRKRK